MNFVLLCGVRVVPSSARAVSSVCVLRATVHCVGTYPVGARARPSYICEFTSEINLEPLISIVNFRLPCLLWCEIGPDTMDFRFRDPTCTVRRAGRGSLCSTVVLPYGIGAGSRFVDQATVPCPYGVG